MTIAVSRNKFIVSFSIIFGTSVGMMSVARLAGSVATAGFFPLDLGFFGVVWVSGYFN